MAKASKTKSEIETTEIPKIESAIPESQEIKESKGEIIPTNEEHQEDAKPILPTNETVKEEKPTVQEPPKTAFKPAESNENKQPEDKIMDFLKSRKSDGFVKVNDFLKSLYPVPASNAPAAWMAQPEMKRLRLLLEKMKSEGKISINNNVHLRLGTHYYDSDVDPRTKYYDLSTLPIEAKAL